MFKEKKEEVLNNGINLLDIISRFDYSDCKNADETVCKMLHMLKEELDILLATQNCGYCCYYYDPDNECTFGDPFLVDPNKRCCSHFNRKRQY